jgi:ElaB/YqjD/DUF883 family membrane-anchored ribosome-binding protein
MQAPTDKLMHDQVRESPWTALGVAAGIGVVVGMMLGRK